MNTSVSDDNWGAQHHHIFIVATLITDILAVKNISKLSFSNLVQKKILDRAAATAITASQRIFFALSNPTWPWLINLL